MTPEELLANSGNAAWMLMSASLVLLMTPALAFFYGGMSRQKSVLNMMMMSFGAIMVVVIIYFLWGWSMSYGTEDIGGVFANPFEFFGLRDSITDADGNYIAGPYGYPNVIDIAFQVTFAIITVALISGAVAERVKYGTWLLFAGLWATLVYFPLAHMVWGGGLLSGAENSFASWIFGTTTNDDGDGGERAADRLRRWHRRPHQCRDGRSRPRNRDRQAEGFGKHRISSAQSSVSDARRRPAVVRLVRLQRGFGVRRQRQRRSRVGEHHRRDRRRDRGLAIIERIRDGHATSVGAASGIVAGLVAITPAAGSLDPDRLDDPRRDRRCARRAGGRAEVQVRLRRFARRRRRPPGRGLWGTIGIGFFA